jgi:hypothetical protein
MPVAALLTRVPAWLLGSVKAGLGTTLGDLRLEREGRKKLRATRAVPPTAVRAPDPVDVRRARIREEIRHERVQAAQLAADA